MTALEVGQYINTILGSVLIVRLISLRLLQLYLPFSCFLIFELFQSFGFLYLSAKLPQSIDYRVVWASFRVPSWLLTFWTVYSLLSVVLKSLPGILKFSQLFLNLVFGFAVAIGLITIGPELSIGSSAQAGTIKHLFLFTLATERALTMSAFIALLAILLFIVWFPVEIPKNLVMFSVGLVVYLGTKTCLLFVHTYMPHLQSNALNAIGMANTVILAICFICWAAVISKDGERATVRFGHSWEAKEQQRLILQLESMNTSLLRARN